MKKVMLFLSLILLLCFSITAFASEVIDPGTTPPSSSSASEDETASDEDVAQDAESEEDAVPEDESTDDESAEDDYESEEDEESEDYESEEDTDSEEDEESDQESSLGENLYEESALRLDGDLVPDVEIGDLFVKIYDKLFVTVTSSQKIAALIVIFFFVISALMSVISFMGNKTKVPLYLVGMLVSAIIFVCVLYAIPILTAFEKWFIS